MGARELGLSMYDGVLGFRDNVFLNSKIENHDEDSKTPLLEKMGNLLLSPISYLACGKTYTIKDKKIEKIELTHDYKNHHLIRIIAIIIFSPAVIAMAGLGTLCKGISFITKNTRSNNQLLAEYHQKTSATTLEERVAKYKALGILQEDQGIDVLFSEQKMLGGIEEQGPLKRETSQRSQIEAMGEILKILNHDDVKIPVWVDCGSALGVYRHGAFIPWDEDVDLGILESDFEEVKHQLQQLPKEKYAIRDWSSYDKPGTLLKLHIKETGEHIDIYTYHFKKGENGKKSTIQYNWSHEFAWIPEEWKRPERICLKPVHFDDVFPLQKADFALRKQPLDAEENLAYEVCMPRNADTYLQLRYGKDLTPPNRWDAALGQYVESDHNHPYLRMLRGEDYSDNEFNYTV